MSTMNNYAVIGAFLLGALVSWWFTDLAADARVSRIEAGHAKQLASIAEERDEQARKALQAQQAAAAAVAEIDKQYEVLTNAQAENERLRAAVADGTRRLSVLAKCPAPARVPDGASASRVDYETVRADVDPRAAARIVGITGRGDEAIRMLTACQAYARTVSR